MYQHKQFSYIGTDAYRNLCIADVGTSPTVWERPGPGGPNRTDLWGSGGAGGAGGGAGGGWDLETGSLFGNDSLEHWGPGGPGLVPGQMEVNECAAFPGLCGHGRCKNMLGSFTCECFPGYEKVSV